MTRRAAKLVALAEHVRTFFAGHEVGEVAWLPGPTAQPAPDFRVLQVSSGPKTRHPVYVSVGASLMNEVVPFEFVLAVSEPHPSHVEVLAMVAHYHATRGLGIGHTFPCGRPCFPNGDADHFLVSLPYIFGPALGECTTTEPPTDFVWLLPVFESEVRYRHSNGLEALESLFETSRFNVLDGKRPPVV